MKNVSMLKKQDGFTLIELIVVMVILGVLAALAVPRFIGFTETARIRSLDGAEGAVKSAAFNVRSQYVATEAEPAADGVTTIDIDGKNIEVDAKGYPLATTNGICLAVDFDEKIKCTATENVATVALDSRANCKFTYALTDGEVDIENDTNDDDSTACK